MKRYDLVNCETGIGCWLEMSEVDNGGYVKYDEASAEIKRLRDAITDIAAIVPIGLIQKIAKIATTALEHKELHEIETS